MYQSTIAEAIQSQRILRIRWQKETTGEYSSCVIAPYDVFPKRKKDSYSEREILMGVEYENSIYGKHVASIYLDTMQGVDVLDQSFDGSEVKRIINPKNHPLIPRNW